MDVGGTKCAALLGNATGEVLDRREWPSRVERGPRAMIDDFLAYARTAPRVVAAGVAIGGPLNAIECEIILSGNSFVNNTTKGERDPRRGRHSFKTGEYERFAELYFTIYEPDDRYGPAIIRDNLFVTGPECDTAIAFGPNGRDLVAWEMSSSTTISMMPVRSAREQRQSGKLQERGEGPAPARARGRALHPVPVARALPGTGRAHARMG
jgi:hypothetical protein